MAYDEATRARGRRTVLLDGAFSKLMDTLTGGVFLAGLGVFLGASNFVIGLLASLPFFAQVAQVAAVKLLLHVTDRRLVAVATVMASRTMLVVLGFLVLLLGAGLPAYVLLALMALAAPFAVISGAAWNWWMRDLIPRDELGRYFGRRLQVITLIGVAALLLAGGFLDALQDRGFAAQGYATLYLVGGTAGYVSAFFLAVTPHDPPPAVTPVRNTGRLLLEPLLERRNRGLVTGLALSSAALTFALPFTAVYLLRSVGYGFVLVTALAVVSQLAYISGLRGWGYLSDRFGQRPVLLIASGMLVVALLGWTLTGFERGVALYAFLLALHFLSGFGVGGLELASANILLKLAPEERVPAFLASMNLTKSAFAAASTVLGGLVWETIGAGELYRLEAFGFAWGIRGFHVLAAVSVGLGLLALLALRHIQEEGVAKVGEVAKAMRREVHMMSSVAGIRGFVHVVSYVVEFLAPVPGAAPAPEGKRRRWKR